MIKGAPIDTKEHQDAIDHQIRNAFSDYVRKERRNLLFLSAVSGFLATANIAPYEVNALGLKISNLKPNFVFISLFALTGYAFVAYWLHAFPECKIAKAAMRKSFHSLDELLTPPLKQRVVNSIAVHWRYSFWLLFDYLLPIVIGLSAIVLLICRICRPV